MSSVCLKLGMSRQNYYAQRRRRQREQVDGDLIERLVQRERLVQPPRRLLMPRMERHSRGWIRCSVC